MVRKPFYSVNKPYRQVNHALKTVENPSDLGKT
jgi:hypothetical protein